MDELIQVLKTLKKGPNRNYIEKTIQIKTDLVNTLIKNIEEENNADLSTALKIKKQILELADFNI